jgi:hypothetical protein
MPLSRTPAALLVTLAILGGGSVATAIAQPSQTDDSVRAARSESGAEISPGGKASARPFAPSLSYKSDFDSYRRYSEETVAPWAETNGTVGTIGGWKAYAREALAAEAAPAGSGKPPIANPAPASPPDPPAPSARPPVPDRGIDGRP